MVFISLPECSTFPSILLIFSYVSKLKAIKKNRFNNCQDAFDRGACTQNESALCQGRKSHKRVLIFLLVSTGESKLCNTEGNIIPTLLQLVNKACIHNAAELGCFRNKHFCWPGYNFKSWSRLFSFSKISWMFIKMCISNVCVNL